MRTTHPQLHGTHPALSKHGPLVPFLCPWWGTQGIYKEGRKDRRATTALGARFSRSSIGPPCAPSFSGEGMDSSSVLPLLWKGPPPPLRVSGVGPVSEVGGPMKEEMGEKVWLGLFP